MMKWIFRLATSAAVLGVLLVSGATAYLSINQESLIFERAIVADDHDWGFDTRVSQHVLERPDGARLHAAYFPLTGAKGTVLFFHGNGQNLAAAPKMAGLFAELGYALLAVQRRAAGNSTGTLGQKALYDDAAAWWDWARARYGDDHDVRVVGYSMGTAWATYLASARPVKDMILFAPFESIIDMSSRRYPAPRWYYKTLLDFPLPSHDNLAAAKGTRVRLYHGKADTIVPIQSSYRLKPFLGDDDSYIEIDGLDHWTIIWDDRTKADLAKHW